MRKRLQKQRDKPYFCHDENIEFASLKKLCSRSARFVNVIHVFNKQKVKDPQIINGCNIKDYHVITHNTAHFQKTHDNVRIGIICINLKDEDIWINKFKKLLKIYDKHKNYHFKTIFVGNDIQIKDRRTDEISLI